MIPVIVGECSLIEFLVALVRQGPPHHVCQEPSCRVTPHEYGGNSCQQVFLEAGSKRNE